MSEEFDPIDSAIAAGFQWVVQKALDYATAPTCKCCGSPGDLYDTTCCQNTICASCTQQSVHSRWLRSDVFICPFCGHKSKA